MCSSKKLESVAKRENTTKKNKHFNIKSAVVCIVFSVLAAFWLDLSTLLYIFELVNMVHICFCYLCRCVFCIAV